MKIDLILKSIGRYKEARGEFSAILKMFLSPDSYAYMRRYARTGRLPHETKRETERRERQNFYNLVNYLVRQGLVEKRESGNKNFLCLTANGKERLFRHKDVKEGVRFKIRDYGVRKDEKLKIIMFDVPEVESRKRKWLRDSLKQMGFKMAQKSVWVGRVSIPVDFLEDLRDLDILPYVDIFIAEKLGTIVN